MDGLDEFGDVQSGVWLEWEYDESDYTDHILFLSTRYGLCEAFQETLTAASQLFDAMDAEDEEGLCSDGDEFYDILYEGFEEQLSEGTRVVKMELSEHEGTDWEDMEHDWATDPEEKSYTIEIGGGHQEAGDFVDMRGYYYSDNPQRYIAEATFEWDEDIGDCVLDVEADEIHDAREDAVYDVLMRSGTLQLEKTGDDFSGTFLGEYEGEDGETGTAEGEFVVTHCPVETTSDDWTNQLHWFW